MNLFSMWNRKGGILRDNSIIFVFVMEVSGVQYKIKQQWFSMDGWIDGWKKILCSTQVKIIIKVWNNMRLNDRFFILVGTFPLKHLIEKPRKVKGE